MCTYDKLSSVDRPPAHQQIKQTCYLHTKFQTSIQIIKQNMNKFDEQQPVPRSIDIRPRNHFHRLSIAHE